MVADSNLINAAKLANRMTTNDFDSEVERLLNAAFLDLGVAGVVVPAEFNDLVQLACITYVRAHFGNPASDVYDRLKKSYDEQKAQLATCTGYTDWLVDK